MKSHGYCARVASLETRRRVALAAVAWLVAATVHALWRAKPCCFIAPVCLPHDQASPVSLPGDGKRTGLPPRTLLTAMGPGFTASCVSLQAAA